VGCGEEVESRGKMDEGVGVVRVDVV